MVNLELAATHLELELCPLGRRGPQAQHLLDIVSVNFDGHVNGAVARRPGFNCLDHQAHVHFSLQIMVHVVLSAPQIKNHEDIEMPRGFDELQPQRII